MKTKPATAFTVRITPNGFRVLPTGGENCEFLPGGTKTRISRIEPCNAFRRIAFLLIRQCVSDDSRAAAWTRRWRGPWRVRFLNKEHSFGDASGFSDRSVALAYEQQFAARHIL